MLPDFRVVTIAVISTFLFAVSVGFYTSSRLMNERKPRPDSLAAIEDHPLNRIALNWPEPVQQQANPPNLDFAVTAKVQRNPVRDLHDEPVKLEAKVAAAPQQTTQNNRAEPSVIDARKIAARKIEAAKVEAAIVEAPKLELPKVEVPKVASPKIEAPAIAAVAPPPLAMAPRARPEDDLPTATIVAAPALNPPSEYPKRQPEAAAGPPAANVATLPEAVEPEADARPEIATEPEVEDTQANPAKKKVRKAKKRAAKKVVKPAPRLRLRPAVTSASNPWGFPFTGFQNQNQGFQTR